MGVDYFSGRSYKRPDLNSGKGLFDRWYDSLPRVVRGAPFCVRRGGRFYGYYQGDPNGNGIIAYNAKDLTLGSVVPFFDFDDQSCVIVKFDGWGNEAIYQFEVCSNGEVFWDLKAFGWPWGADVVWVDKEKRERKLAGLWTDFG